MDFNNSSPLFKALEKGNMHQLKHEALKCSSSQLVQTSTGLIRINKTLRVYNLLEACCLIENKDALKTLLTLKVQWPAGHLQKAASLAAHAKDGTLMQELIAFGFPVHEAFLAACRVGNCKLAELILAENPLLERQEIAPLLSAAAGGFLTVLHLLNDSGFDLHAGNDEALCVAIRNKQADCVYYLLEQGADVSVQGDLPLKIALVHGDLPIVKRLLAHGANLKKIAQEEFISLAEQHNHPELVTFLRQELARANLSSPLNISQSIHTDSVDKSAAESAIRLQQRYLKQCSSAAITHYISELVLWRSRFDNSIKDLAAGRALNAILTSDVTHAKTGISLKEVLCLCWIAIHDEKLRQTSLLDALAMLKEGLYELQRGYNFSMDGVDLGENDKNICEPGKFNKLMEKLVSVHPDVEIDFVTKELASLKLRIVVQEEFMAFYNANPVRPFGLFDKKYTLDEVWDKIREKVKQRMFNEFSSLFTAYDDAEFNEFIDMGIYTNVDEINRRMQP